MKLSTLTFPATIALTMASQAHAAESTAPTPADLAQDALLDRIRALEATVERLEARLSTQPAAAPLSAPAPTTQAPPARPPGAITIASAPAPTADDKATHGKAPNKGSRMQLQLGAHTLTAGGFLKVQAAVSDYSGGNLASTSSGRELLLPGTIPIGGASSRDTHIDARTSRFWIATKGDIAGLQVGTRLEVDLLYGDIDNRTTNGTSIRLRRAFLTSGNFLFGQEWTNFQDTRAFPESGNLIGPSAGTLLVRQAQLRYTRGRLSVSLENPETTYSPVGEATRMTTGDGVMPDITARYTMNTPGGFLSLAGLLVHLRSDTSKVSKTALGWAASASGRIRTWGDDDIRFQLNGGRGYGRYLLNFANDAVLDAQGDLNTIPILSGFVAYRHFWAPRIRSTVTLDAQRVYNPDYASAGSNRSAIGAQLNLIWSPVPSLDFGIEHIWLRRELESRAAGTLNRSMFFAKFGF